MRRLSAGVIEPAGGWLLYVPVGRAVRAAGAAFWFSEDATDSRVVCFRRQSRKDSGGRVWFAGRLRRAG